MSEEQYRFSIIFEELNKLLEEFEIRLEDDELEEYEEVRVLREIILEIQAPVKAYLTST